MDIETSPCQGKFTREIRFKTMQNKLFKAISSENQIKILNRYALYALKKFFLSFALSASTEFEDITDADKMTRRKIN